MALAFVAVLAWPVARATFELQLLSLTDFGIVAAVGAGWVALAHAVARGHKDASAGYSAVPEAYAGRADCGQAIQRRPIARAT